LIVNASLAIPSLAVDCEICKDSRSVPGGAGVLTTPRAALVSPDGSVRTVTPGGEQGFSAALGWTAISDATDTATEQMMMTTTSLKRVAALNTLLTIPLLIISFSFSPRSFSVSE
jgi:hypothetical protein